MSDTNSTQIHATGEATGFIHAPDEKGKPITVIGTNSIRAGFDATCLQQALNARSAPGVTDLVLNPDAHAGYGAPVGCVLTSPTYVYPGPVGVDIKCSMSFLQLDLPADQVTDKTVRRALIDAILERTPNHSHQSGLNVLSRAEAIATASRRGNGAYLRPKTFLPNFLRRGGCGTVSNRTRRLKRCISLSVAWRRRYWIIAERSHWYCSLDRATLTVLPLTLRVDW